MRGQLRQALASIFFRLAGGKRGPQIRLLRIRFHSPPLGENGPKPRLGRRKALLCRGFVPSESLGAIAFYAAAGLDQLRIAELRRRKAMLGSEPIEVNGGLVVPLHAIPFLIEGGDAVLGTIVALI